MALVSLKLLSRLSSRESLFEFGYLGLLKHIVMSRWAVKYFPIFAPFVVKPFCYTEWHKADRALYKC